MYYKNTEKSVLSITGKWLIRSNLRPLLNRRSKLSPDNKLTVYKTILLPVMAFRGSAKALIEHNLHPELPD